MRILTARCTHATPSNVWRRVTWGRPTGGVEGCSISPNLVQDVLDNPDSVTPVKRPSGEGRLSYVSGSVQVITEKGIVVTVITR